MDTIKGSQPEALKWEMFVTPCEHPVVDAGGHLIVQDEVTQAESKSGLPMFGDRFTA